LRATEFEFRFRFLFIMAIYIGGFWCYALDPVNVSELFAQQLRHAVGLGVRSDRHVLQAILTFGAALAVLGALVRTWAAAYLRSDVVHDTKLHGEGLVADGPYRYVRNPLYLGGLLFAVGFALAASRLGCVVIVGGLALFFYRLVLREESILVKTQGESYRHFLAAVPRLMPSLTPRVAAGGLIPRWGQAMMGEMFMWLFAAAIACFAATLNKRLFLTIMVSGVAASFLAKAALRRRRHPDMSQS